MLTEWIEESYRAVAPKSIVAALPDSAHRLDATRWTGQSEPQRRNQQMSEGHDPEQAVGTVTRHSATCRWQR